MRDHKPRRWMLSGQIHGLNATESVLVMPVSEHEAELERLRAVERAARALVKVTITADGIEDYTGAYQVLCVALSEVPPANPGTPPAPIPGVGGMGRAVSRPVGVPLSVVRELCEAGNALAEIVTRVWPTLCAVRLRRWEAALMAAGRAS